MNARSSVGSYLRGQFGPRALWGDAAGKLASKAAQSFTMVLLLSTHSLLSNSQQAHAQSSSFTLGSASSVSAPQMSALKWAGSEGDTGRAWQHWALNCQGCHLADGQGTQETGKLSGTVARFLWVPGGRDYLIRVPGVATSQLPDEDLAELVNWMLLRFDKQHIPASFRPYTAAEVARLRARPLRLEAAQMRDELLRKVNEEISAATRSRS